MTNQERLRKSVKFWVMRKLWAKAGDVSRWAGRRIVKWSLEADKMDFMNADGQREREMEAF